MEIQKLNERERYRKTDRITGIEQSDKEQREWDRQTDRNTHRIKEIIKMKWHKKESKGYGMVTLDYCLR